MPGSIRSMHLEHVLRDVQTDRANLLHGRLLWWQFDTVTLARRCRRGASTPSPDAVSCWPCREGLFSIAASVKFRPDDFMLSPFCASATDTPRGSCFSSRLAPGHLMMG